MKKIIFLFTIISLISACKPNKPIQECKNTSIEIIENKQYLESNVIRNSALILNEGGFTYGNASITEWKENSILNQQVYQMKNNNSIGDVLQSAYKYGNEIYFVLNNSQKIEVVDKNSLERIKTIAGFTSPRYMTIANNIAFVTELFDNKISVFNIETGCEKESITMNGWTEQIFFVNEKIFVIERSEVGASTLFANIVEIGFETVGKDITYSIKKRTAIAIEPQSVQLDSDNNIWILSSGKESENVFPTLTKFNTNSKSIEISFSKNTYTNKPQNLVFDNNNIYYNQGNDIFKITTNDYSFSATKEFTTDATNIYSLAFNNSKIFVFDAKDYVSEGEVFVYNNQGTLIETIQTGIIPSKIIF